MKWMSRFLAVWLLGATGFVNAAEDNFPAPGDETEKYRTEVVAKGLDNPCGLALRPSVEKDAPQEIYFAESGAGRVMRLVGSGEPQEVLTGLETRTLEKPAIRLSASALGFVTASKLAVLGGLKKEYLEQVGLFVLPGEQRILTPADMEGAVTLKTFQDVVFQESPGFHGMIVGDTVAIFSNYVPNRFGDIYRASLSANRIDEPQRMTFRQAGDSLVAPAGLCMVPPGRTQYLVASFMDEMGEDRDSRVAFIVPSSGVVALELVPGLLDVVGLAYSPWGNLYAIDFATGDDKAGGVYRLDDARLNNRPACRAVKIVEIARPTSLIFDKYGVLYVSSLGPEGSEKQGQIIKVSGEF
jgi:hypothetical protein